MRSDNEVHLTKHLYLIIKVKIKKVQNKYNICTKLKFNTDCTFFNFFIKVRHF